ncbi:alpha/beta hydrolase [Kitasatospora aureofaciens]|uniref:alpha/beta hydrolase n=1 Tax=Kitasatospora aureofaciens TaxID=1894 RepID=UPI0033F9513C
MSSPAALGLPTRLDGDPDRVALVIPGAGYSPARPLLHFAGSVLQRHGWTVQELWWHVPDAFREFTTDDRIDWVERQVAEAVDAEHGACRLLVGKSLGSFAAGLGARHPARRGDRQVAFVGRFGEALVVGDEGGERVFQVLGTGEVNGVERARVPGGEAAGGPKDRVGQADAEHAVQ